jgi:hypothetical protein
MSKPESAASEHHDQSRFGGLSRPKAGVYLAAAIVSLGLGCLVYAWFAPTVPGGIVDVELGGGSQVLPDTSDLRSAVFWDLVLIAGYGSALYFAGLLAAGVFRAPSGKRLARVGWRLTVAAVAADLIENFVLLLALDTTGGRQDRLLDAVAMFAVIKFCCLLPAALVAAWGIAATVSRLVTSRERVPSRREKVKSLHVIAPWPLVRETTESQIEEGTAEGAGRWRRGFLLPDLTSEQVAERAAERAKMPAEEDRAVVGFCLSGGGIRSGSVALGALQTLRSELVRADYLVSVSGGGYVSGALQMCLADASPPPASLTESDAPVEDIIRSAEEAFMPGSVEEDRFRRHANYVANTSGQLIVALAVVARGLVLSLTVLFGPAIVLGWLAGRGYEAIPLVDWDPERIDPTQGDSVEFPTVSSGAWLAIGVTLLAAVLAYATMLFRAAYMKDASPGGGLRKAAIAITGVALLVAILAVAIPSLVFLSSWLFEKAGSVELAVGGSLVTVLLSYVATIATFARRRMVREKVGGLFSRGASSPVAAVPTGALQQLLVLLALAALGLGWLLLFGGVAAVAASTSVWPIAGVACLLILLGGLLDQTFLSLHPFYRRRLARAFAMRRVRLESRHTVALEYSYDERTRLSRYGKRAEKSPRLPQVIFAAAANLTGEDRAPLGAVSYTFTDRWVGGPDIGYVQTQDLEEEPVVSEQLSRDMTVQAAIAISGAAVAAAMGREGRWYSALLAVTGARLGTWLPNPYYLAKWRGSALRAEPDWWTVPAMPRVRRLPYLVREVINRHTIHDRLLQITDGGHYENLGLVELLRRRCTKIYCIDASGGSSLTTGTLASAITLAHAELGVVIKLDDPWKLVPGSGKAFEPSDPLSALNARLSESGVITGTITYPEESGLPEGARDGLLVVVKTRLTPQLDYELLSYSARNSVFPHDSTGDQFFDDDKFCAYTALGRQLGLAAKASMPMAP